MHVKSRLGLLLQIAYYQSDGWMEVESRKVWCSSSLVAIWRNALKLLKNSLYSYLKEKSGEFSHTSPFLEVNEYCRYETIVFVLFCTNSNRWPQETEIFVKTPLKSLVVCVEIFKIILLNKMYVVSLVHRRSRWVRCWRGTSNSNVQHKSSLIPTTHVATCLINPKNVNRYV